ncbi:MAG: hypothetical protein J6V92_09760 [Bacteroidaceae bacterium]|jgi:hypothetical protein|nr:hypothetical protein [Bacteroidaceae bacterium]
MKKTYIQPTSLAVEMQEDQIIAFSVEGNTGMQDGGSSDNYDGPDFGAAKESHSVWDEEW